MKPNTQLKYERERRGWSQAKLAEAIGTNPVNVSRWERGISVPYPYFQEKLCALLGKDAQELGFIHRDDAEDLPIPPQPSAPMQHSSGPTSYVQAALLDPAMPIPFIGTHGLIGRDSLLQHLKERLCAGGNEALTALTGLPGVGKTALAVALAHDKEIKHYFSGGVLWVGLGPHPDVTRLLKRWGMLLGILSQDMSSIDSREGLAFALREAIGTRRLLLAIDDAYSIEDAQAFKVGGLHCAHLLTTRFPRVAVSFALDEAVMVPELEESDGLSLLARYAPEVVGKEPETAQTLVRSVGALPLALKLMGKYLRVQASAGQPRRLRTAIDRLTNMVQRLSLAEPYSIIESPPNLPVGTPLSLQSVIRVSDGQLSQQAQVTLRALAAFPAKPNSFSEEAALTVSQVGGEVLDELSDSGLLESSSAGRYMLHQTIADYAHLHLQDQRTYQRLIDYYVNYAEQHQKAYELLDRESSNILAALDTAYRLGQQMELVRGECAFAHFLQMRGVYDLAAEHLERAYSAAKELGDHSGLTKILLPLGLIARECGEMVQAEAYLQEGLVVARQLEDKEQIARLLVGLGWVATERSKLAQGEIYHQEGLALARQLDLGDSIVDALCGLGWAAFEQQDFIRAKTYWLEALGLGRRIGEKELISRLYAGMGWVSTALAEYEQADSYLKQGLELASEINCRVNICYALNGMGWQASKLHEFEQAVNYYQKSLALAHRIHHRETLYRVHTYLGWIAAKRGHYGEAEQHYQEALVQALQHEKPRFVCTILSHQGKLCLKQGQYEKAIAIYKEMMSLIPDDSEYLAELAQQGLALAIAARQEDMNVT